MPFKEASMQHTTSCGQNILDTQVNGPYTASNEKQVLIKQKTNIIHKQLDIRSDYSIIFEPEVTL